jgi:hypothetical protein
MRYRVSHKGLVSRKETKEAKDAKAFFVMLTKEASDDIVKRR